MTLPIESPTRGRVRLIEVEIGDRVDPGDVVVIVAGHDGEVRAEADESGTVVSIDVAEGESVIEGDILITLG